MPSLWRKEWWYPLYVKTDGSRYGRQTGENHDRKPAFRNSQLGGLLNGLDGRRRESIGDHPEHLRSGLVRVASPRTGPVATAMPIPAFVGALQLICTLLQVTTKHVTKHMALVEQAVSCRETP